MHIFICLSVCSAGRLSVRERVSVAAAAAGMNENDWLNVWEFKQQLLEISLIHIFRRWRRCKLSWFNCCFCFCCCSAADVDADVADSMSATFVVVVVWLHLARLNDLEHAVCFFFKSNCMKMLYDLSVHRFVWLGISPSSHSSAVLLSIVHTACFAVSECVMHLLLFS